MDVRDMYHGNAFMYRAGDKLNKTAFMLSILATVYIYIYYI